MESHTRGEVGIGPHHCDEGPAATFAGAGPSPRGMQLYPCYALLK